MKFTLVNYYTEIEKDVQFGTCDMCFSTGTAEYDYFVFRDEDGEEFTVEGFMWSWGDFMTVPHIENIVDFSNWLNTKDFSSRSEIDNYGSLSEVIYDYIYPESEEG